MSNYTEAEAYKIICENLMPIDGRDALRLSREFQQFTKIWNDKVFNSKNRVGSLMQSINQLHPTATRADWAHHFFKNNLSPVGVIKQVEEVAEAGNIDFTKALNIWWCHLQDSVYNGWNHETQLFTPIREYAQSKGYDARPATDIEDRCYGVDVIIFNPATNDVITGVQIKGEKYFKSPQPTVVRAREKIDPPKYAEFTKIYNAPVWYVIIEKSLKNGSLSWFQHKTTTQ